VAATVVIDERFCGPPGSANGGYACGRTAAPLRGPVEVTLRVPPPLGRPLALEHGDGRSVLRDGDVLVAEGRETTLELDVPAPVSWPEAQAATARYPWRDRHPYPTCFVCGPRRTPGDGLCVYAGPVEGRDVFAAPWTPDASLGDDGAAVRREFAWAALDCPSGIVTDLLGDDVGRMLLGRLTADLRLPVEVGADYVLQAWPLERDGRKLHTASALFSAAGELHAVARAVWIEVA
jgi:hypothetical protein